MTCYASDLTTDQRAALESLLGRRVNDGEAISLSTFEPTNLSTEQRLEIADELREYFVRVDKSRRAVSDEVAEETINEAMRSVRPGYRPLP